jgi:hypothetical protein
LHHEKSLDNSSTLPTIIHTTKIRAALIFIKSKIISSLVFIDSSIKFLLGLTDFKAVGFEEANYTGTITLPAYKIIVLTNLE